MTGEKFKVGDTSPADGLVIKEILGQSERAIVFISASNELRWTHHGIDGPMSAGLSRTIDRFDVLMTEVKALRISKEQKRELLTLLGKRLFSAMNASKPRSPASAFKVIEDQIRKYNAASLSPVEGGIEPFEVVVVCALDDPELKALMEFGDWSEMSTVAHDPQLYVWTCWTSRNGTPIRVIAAAPNHMGLVAAGTLAAKMIWRFRPLMICIAGIAAGYKSEKQGFGDILVPDQTFDHGTSKTVVEDGKLKVIASPQPLQINARLLNRLRAWCQKRANLNAIADDWQPESPSTKLQAHIGPLFSSSTVLGANEPLDDVANHWRKLLGAEMEAHAVHQAAHNTIDPEPIFLCMKSICDFAAGKNDEWREYAAYTSARSVKDFISSEWDNLVALRT